MKTPSLKTITQYLTETVNWNQYFSMIFFLQQEKGLNDRMNRANKGKLLEQGLQSFSNGKIIRINADGYDHILSEFNNLRIELKTAIETGIMFTKSGNPKRGKTSSISLVNTMGNNTTSREYVPEYKFLVMIDHKAAACAKVDSVVENVVFTNDQIKTQLDFSDIEFIVRPGDYKTMENLHIIPYLVGKEQYDNTYISQFLLHDKPVD